jgi:aldose sugar dehydrogenase
MSFWLCRLWRHFYWQFMSREGDRASRLPEKVVSAANCVQEFVVLTSNPSHIGSRRPTVETTMKRFMRSTTRGAVSRRAAWRALVVVSMACALLAPAGGAMAQLSPVLPVTFEGDLQYVPVWEAPGGESAVTPAYSGITGLDVAPDGRVYFAEHHGGIQVLDPKTGVATYLGRVNAATHKCGAAASAGGQNVDAGDPFGCGETGLWESGLHGFALAHDFAQTGHLYVSYAVANSSCDIPDNIAGEKNAGCWHLSRFKVDSAGPLGTPSINFANEKVLLTWPFSRYAPDNPGGRSAAHQGGGIEVLPDGSIVVAVGDNTSHASHGGYGPRDPRPERWYYNGERTSQNPADRRGKLLRVNPDGSVPADNPFVGKTGEYIYGQGAVEYDPYILAMGMRNPYRLASDPVTGAVYSGQVGPDARVDDPARGPRGEEELNVIGRSDCAEPTATGECPFEAFNGGFPRCIGPGRPYIDFDFAKNVTKGVPLDCSKFDQPALYYYPSTQGSPWPELNTGGGNTIAPLEVYQSKAPGALAQLQNSLLLFDWARGWLATIPVTEDGSLDVRPDKVNRIATGFTGPVDAAVAPDGSVYVAELGGYFSVASRIGRITAVDLPVGVASVVPDGSSMLGTTVPVAAVTTTLLLGVGALRRRRRIV